MKPDRKKCKHEWSLGRGIGGNYFCIHCNKSKPKPPSKKCKECNGTGRTHPTANSDDGGYCYSCGGKPKPPYIDPKAFRAMCQKLGLITPWNTSIGRKELRNALKVYLKNIKA